MTIEESTFSKNRGKNHTLCYFSAGTYEPWRRDAGQFAKDTLGKPMEAWPDERWVDFTKSSVQAVMVGRLRLAAEKGCDGVEPDNVDAYDNDSGLSLSSDDQLGYNRWLAQKAHELSLSIGLNTRKNKISKKQKRFAKKLRFGAIHQL